MRKREIAILIPTVFCAVVFTIYLFTGAGEGSAILWSLLLPIGMCYFVSVKYGIILSIYYSILYMAVFYSPLRERISMYYNATFIQRFPILFITLSVFTGMAMVQYHRNALLEIDYTRRLNEEVARQTAVAEERARRIEQMSFQTIQTLANAIDAKDPYTKGHSSRVSQYSVMIAQNMGWSKERVNNLRYAALLHDIGKIGVPDSILNNPKRLTDFLDSYTLKYSHSDYRHAVQLIGLLRSEGIDAYIQVEPKVSVYEYRLEWGTPAGNSPTYAIQLTEQNRYLCYSVEYDLMIEFDTAEDKERFHGLIETYAKKYDDRVGPLGNVTAKLLAGSWWQPLYSSATPMQNGEYQSMIENVIYDKAGMYSIHTFTLPEDAPAVAEVVARTAPELNMSAVEINVNPAFVRYVTGEDHQ